MFVFDKIDGLVEVDVFFGVVKQTDLVIALNDAAEANAHQADQHSSIIEFVE
jgi:hypothetical protein